MSGRGTWTLGLAVGVIHLGTYSALAKFVGPLYEDASEFSSLADGLAQHFHYGAPSAYRAPGWPALLALPYRIFGTHPALGLALNAVLVGLAVVGLIHLGQALGLSPFQARLAAVGYGLFPWVIVIGSTLYAETLFNSLTILIALLLVKFHANRPPAWQWAALGLLCGYTIMVRTVLVFWLPVGLLFALGRRFAWKSAAAMLLGTVVIVGAWSWRNVERLDAFVPFTTAGGGTLAVANNDAAGSGQAPSGLPPVRGGEVARDRAYKEFAQDWIREHPAEFASRVPQRIVRTFDPVTRLNKGVFAPPALRWTARVLWLIALSIIGLGLFNRHRGAWLIPVSLAVMLTLPVAVFGGGFRFLIPALPFLALWFVAGASELWAKFRPARPVPPRLVPDHRGPVNGPPRISRPGTVQ